MATNSYNLRKEEIIPLAKENGFDFSLEDMKELGKSNANTLSDDELEQVAGGRGQFSTSYSYYEQTIISTLFCELAPDDSTFITLYNSFPNNCLDFVHVGCGSSHIFCGNCKHLQGSMTVS